MDVHSSKKQLNSSLESLHFAEVRTAAVPLVGTWGWLWRSVSGDSRIKMLNFTACFQHVTKCCFRGLLIISPFFKSTVQIFCLFVKLRGIPTQATVDALCLRGSISTNLSHCPGPLYCVGPLSFIHQFSVKVLIYEKISYFTKYVTNMNLFSKRFKIHQKILIKSAVNLCPSDYPVTFWKKQSTMLPLGPVKPERPVIPGSPMSPFSTSSAEKGLPGNPGGPGNPLSPAKVKTEECWCKAKVHATWLINSWPWKITKMLMTWFQNRGPHHERRLLWWFNQTQSLKNFSWCPKFRMSI